MEPYYDIVCTSMMNDIYRCDASVGKLLLRRIRTLRCDSGPDNENRYIHRAFSSLDIDISKKKISYVNKQREITSNLTNENI